MKLYYSGDGTRAYISCKDSDNKWKYYPYARYLMEEYLGRPLKKDEEVHHINGDKTDDRLINLKIVNRTHHRKYHAQKYPENIKMICPECNQEFILTKEQRSKYIQGRSKRLFCSKSCAGKCGRREQLGRDS